MFLIKCERADQAFSQRNGGTPSERRTNPAEIGVIIPDVDPLAIGRIREHDEFAPAVYLDQQSGKVIKAYDAIAAQIENFAVRRLARRRHQKGVNRVVNVSEVAQLMPFPDLE